MFPKCTDKTLGVCGVKSLLVYLRQILRKKKIEDISGNTQIFQGLG